MTIGSNSERELEALIERVERLEEEKAKIAEDIKNVYAEASITGFNVERMKQFVELRRWMNENPDIFRLYARAAGLSFT